MSSCKQHDSVFWSFSLFCVPSCSTSSVWKLKKHPVSVRNKHRCVSSSQNRENRKAFFSSRTSCSDVVKVTLASSQRGGSDSRRRSHCSFLRSLRFSSVWIAWIFSTHCDGTIFCSMWLVFLKKITMWLYIECLIILNPSLYSRHRKCG